MARQSATSSRIEVKGAVISTNVLVIAFESPPQSQAARLRDLGYYVESCVVDTGDTAEEVTRLHLESRTFDCVLFDAGLCAREHGLLFEKLLNLVHARAPLAKMCFNSGPEDVAAAVQRWA
jgi:hypothetical protein